MNTTAFRHHAEGCFVLPDQTIKTNKTNKQ
jgi:hypothetical protein